MEPVVALRRTCPPFRVEGQPTEFLTAYIFASHWKRARKAYVPIDPRLDKDDAIALAKEQLIRHFAKMIEDSPVLDES